MKNILSRFAPAAIIAAACCFLSPVSKASASETAVTLEWDASVSPNVSGYKLYYGTESGVYTRGVTVAGNNTSFRLSNLTLGGTYYFTVTAIGAADGLESLPSNEIMFQAGQTYAQTALAQFRQQLQMMGITGAMAASMEASYAGFLAQQTAAMPAPLPETPLLVESVPAAETSHWNWTLPSQRSVFAGTPEVEVSEMERQASGSWSFALQAPLNDTVEIYGSADLVTWHILDTVENPTGVIEVTEAVPSDAPRLYYEVHSTEE